MDFEISLINVILDFSFSFCSLLFDNVRKSATIKTNNLAIYVVNAAL